MRYKEYVGFRVSKEDREFVRAVAKRLGISESEMWRRLVVVFRIMYSDELNLSDIIKPSEKTMPILLYLDDIGDIPLPQALRPIPEIMKILELKKIGARSC